MLVSKLILFANSEGKQEKNQPLIKSVTSFTIDIQFGKVSILKSENLKSLFIQLKTLLIHVNLKKCCNHLTYEDVFKKILTQDCLKTK